MSPNLRSSCRIAILTLGVGVLLPAQAARSTAADAAPGSIASISAGNSFTCATTAGGTAKCWGYGVQGTLGDGTKLERALPGDVLELDNAAGISTGGGHACAVTTSGAVKCWGVDIGSDLSRGFVLNLVPVGVAPLENTVASIHAGYLYICALTVRGGVKCWGSNGYGQVGDGSDPELQAFSPVDVAGLGEGVSSVAVGPFHACALMVAGNVRCWGLNGSGQLGNGRTDAVNTTPVDVGGLTARPVMIAAGHSHTCALSAQGGVQCWGDNIYGQLGDGTTTDRLTPVDVKGLDGEVAAISLGTYHSCALMVTGAVKCWGLNDEGQLGNGTLVDSAVPMEVVNLDRGAVAIDNRYNHSCAVMGDGGAKCWGVNTHGQLGDGTKVTRLVATPVMVAPAPDTTPDPFAFASASGLAPFGGLSTSNTIVPAGYSAPAPISVSNGEYSVGCNALFTATPGTITPGQSVCVRHNIATTPATSVTTTLTIGGVFGTFTSTTLGSAILSLSPASLEFGAQTIGTASAGQVVTLTNTGDGGASFIANAADDFSVTARSCPLSTIAPHGTCTFTVVFTPTAQGPRTGTFGVLSGVTYSIPLTGSGAGDTTPDAFTFASASGLAPLGGIVNSAPITPAGYNYPAPITVANGEYSVACNSVFTAVAGTINPGQSVCVRHNVSTSPGTSVTTTLTIGGVSGTFTSTTLGSAALSISPASLDFGNQRVGTISAGQVITLTNTGAGSASFLASTSGDFAIAARTCGGTIAPNSTCTFTIVFMPTVQGPRSSGFGVLSGNSYNVSVAGFGVPLEPGDIASIASGPYHACALARSGGVKCWGDNGGGQLGDGSTTRRPTAVAVQGLASNVTAITAGVFHTCALMASGGAKCWGSNTVGQIGDGSGANVSTPVDVAGLSSGVIAIAAGGAHTCALTTSGGVKCWGDNFNGQLGDNSTTDRPTAVDVSGLSSGVAAISAGDRHTCAVMSDGRVKCWGHNAAGKLGDSTTIDRHVPVDVAGGASGFASVTAGFSHTCALTTGGAAKCWGGNANGELGDGTTTNRFTPVNVAAMGSGVSSIAVGGSHTCAITPFGVAKCWGANAHGQLGTGSLTESHTPVEVAGLDGGALAIMAGAYSTCALASGPGVKCWGANFSGQLGDNTLTNRSVPVDVIGVVSFDSTPDPFTFPSRNGVVLFGPQVSDAVTPTGYDLAAPISIANGTYSIGCGFSGTYTSSAGTINPGQSVCVQHNAAPANGTSVTTTLTIGGVSGTFTTTTAGGSILSLSPASLDFGSQPVGIPGTGRTVTLGNTGDGSAAFLAATSGDFAITASSCGLSIPAHSNCDFTVVFTPTASGPRSSSFAVLSGSVYSIPLTGTGQKLPQSIVFGQMLDRAVGVRFTVKATASSGLPVGFTSLSPLICTVSNADVTLISPGTCTIRSEQPGNQSYEAAPNVSRSFAVAGFRDPADVVVIGAGKTHTCAITSGGALQCWGMNQNGELGDGTQTFTRAFPREVVGLSSGIVAVAPGGSGTCALTSDGGMKCWGASIAVGDGVDSSSPRLSPANVVGLATGVISIASGVSHSCAVTSSGGVKCWGFNSNGSLGNGTLVSSGPTDVTGLTSGGLAVASAVNGPASCALTTEGGVKCWGTGPYSDPAMQLVPALVPGLSSGFAEIAVASGLACARTSGGRVKCWVWSGADRLVAKDIPGLADEVQQVVTGDGHACALSTAGRVQCWGRNAEGQLGDGTRLDRVSPVEVTGLASGVAAIAAGSSHSCALMTTGGIKCWGDNSRGQIGDSSNTARLTPVQVTGFAGIDRAPDDTTLSYTRLSVPLASTQAFTAITPTGFYDPANVSVSSGEYSIGCNGTFTTADGSINPGDALCVRHIAADTYAQAVTTTLTIGGTVFTFKSVTVSRAILGISGSSLSFGGQPVGTTSTPRTLTVSNLSAGNDALDFGVGVIGDFSIASSTCGSTLAGGSSCTMAIVFTPLFSGGRADELLVFSTNGDPPLIRVLLTGTGTAVDATPNAFTFADQFLVPTNSLATSAPVQITGVNVPTPIAVVGGTYVISSSNACDGDVQSSTVNPGFIANGQYVCVRHTASPVPGGSNDTQLIVGGVGDTFTTVTIDPVPAPFSFAPKLDVARSAPQVSAPAIITGINTASPVAIAGGEHSIGCTGVFTSAVGSIAGGQPVCVRHTSSPAFRASVTTTLTIGGVSAMFVSTTVAAQPPRLPQLPDFNGDGKPDLIWSNTANGATYFWHMNGTALLGDSFVTQIDPSWKIQGVADFNGDGHPDLIWRNTANGNTYVWYMNGATFISDAFVFSLPPEWVIQGVADFNGDGKPDFLLRNINSGAAFAWFFNDATPIGDQFLFGIDPGWKVEAVADLNGDGQPDLLFRNMTSGLAFAWNTQYAGGVLSLAASSAPIFGIDPVWEIVQLEDWNGDGDPDLLFRNRDTGLVFVWYMNGTTLAGSDFVTQIDPSWEIVPRR